MNKFFIIICLSLTFCLYSTWALGNETGESYKLFKSNTYVKNPLDLRDPFKRRINKKKTNMDRRVNESGYYSNQASIMNIKSLEDIKVIGIVIGPERRAMIKSTGSSDAGMMSDTFFVKEGMFIGENNAEVKAILPGGIVLVEKIRNVYDQDEYLETVIPVSEN